MKKNEKCLNKQKQDQDAIVYPEIEICHKIEW